MNTGSARALPLLVFDYDGTLHNTMKIYAPALRAISEKIGVPCPTDKVIESWLGLSAEEMWCKFMPEMSRKERADHGAAVGALMARSVKDGISEWYAGAEDSLDELKAKGFEMIILSNCPHEYASLHSNSYRTDRWFSGFYACEDYQYMPKSEVVKRILKDKVNNKIIMIGDRIMDLEAAKAVGSPFIGCQYGFGSESELKEADILISSASDISIAVSDIISRQDI